MMENPVAYQKFNFKYWLIYIVSSYYIPDLTIRKFVICNEKKIKINKNAIIKFMLIKEPYYTRTSLILCVMSQYLS